MTSHQLFQEWTTYEKVVAHDYMHHQLYFATLIDYLSTVIDSSKADISVLDLGCGDAKPMIPILDRFNVRHYTGIDTSSEALGRAQELFSHRDVQFELIAATMEEGIKSATGPFDVIIASYSIHHLTSFEKELLLKQSREKLAQSGTLAIIDVFLEPGEARQAYLDRWEQNTREVWCNALSEHEILELIDHVRESDIPETFADYQKMASRSGFESAISLRKGSERLNQLVVLSNG